MEKERKPGLSNLTEFLSTGIWRIRASELRGSRSFLIRQLRIILLAVRGFNDDRCQLRASALTFYSLLSVVPMIAMAFGVSKGFGLEQRLEKQLLKVLPDQQQVVSRIVEFARSFLENTEGGLIAGVGVVVLFWSVIKLMGNIEKSFNDIWGVQKGRSLARRFADYLSIIVIAPILLAMASSVTVLITSHINVLTDKVTFLRSAGPLLMGILKLLPYGVIWILFTLLYVLMPNTSVKIKSALLGGILAGTLYQLVQWVYIKFQVGVSTYGAIYGSFAALPLFLIWLQMSWLVVLLGAEISFAEQHVDTYEFEPDCNKVSKNLKRLLALRITQLCVRNFQAKGEPWSAVQISDCLGVPIRLVRQSLSELTEARVLSEVRTEEEKTAAYQPARAIGSLTVREVIDLLDQSGVDAIPYRESPEWEKLAERLGLFNETIKTSSVDIALADL
jgi:membrane protein